MIDRDERVRHGLGGLAGGHEVDQLARAGHVDGVGRHELAPGRAKRPVQRLDDEELHALEAGGLDGRDDGPDHAGELHAGLPPASAGRSGRPGCPGLAALAPDPRGEAGVRGQVLGHLAMKLGNDALRQAGRPRDPPGADLDRRLHVGHRPVEQEIALAAEVVGETDLEEADPGALEPGVGGLEDRGDRGGLDDAQRLARRRAASPRIAATSSGWTLGRRTTSTHGTGTDNNDIAEGRAIEKLFEKRIPKVSSTKPYTGHTTSAAGSIEAIISILSILHQVIWPNLNFKEPMDDLTFIPVTDLLKNVNVNFVMSNSFGFGGNDTSLIFRRVMED